MDSDDCKSWMLARNECEELHCPHLLTIPATRDDPAERDCTRQTCPHDEPARLRFRAVRAEVLEEALTESWGELVGPLERFLAAPTPGSVYTESAISALRELQLKMFRAQRAKEGA